MSFLMDTLKYFVLTNICPAAVKCAVDPEGRINMQASYRPMPFVKNTAYGKRATE